MTWGRANSNLDDKNVSTLIAYDLQARTHVENMRNNHAYINLWSPQLGGVIDSYISAGERINEVWVGEAVRRHDVARC